MPLARWFGDVTAGFLEVLVQLGWRIVRVTVKLYGNLRRLLEAGQETMELDLPEGSTVGRVVDVLGLSRREIGLTTIRERIVGEDFELGPGETVDIFSVIGGG